MHCGNREKTSFWFDTWLQGKSPAQIAPSLTASFRQSERSKERTVTEAMSENRWISDLRELSVRPVIEYIGLWNLFQAAPELTNKVDSFRWRLTVNGTYPTTSAYKFFFYGRTTEDHALQIWKKTCSV
jgi:hypothetical protein